MSKTRYMVWSNFDQTPDLFKRAEFPGATDEELSLIADKHSKKALDDTRSHLDRTVGSRIIAIANMMCHKKVCEYHFIDSGNIKDCLTLPEGCDCAAWYVDAYGNLYGEIKCRGETKHYIYRAMKPNIGEKQLKTFLGKIENGSVTPTDLSAVTTNVGSLIAGRYGWNVRAKVK